MSNELTDPKTVSFALKFISKLFLGLIVVILLIFFIEKFNFHSGVRDTAAELFYYQKTYGEIAEVGISILIADIEEKRIQGLGGFESLRENQAMLFKFDETGNHGFWMKNMNFSIDIIWMNEYFEIIYIEENISPETYPKTYGTDIESKYVLETVAGFVEKNAVKVGDMLQVL